MRKKNLRIPVWQILSIGLAMMILFYPAEAQKRLSAEDYFKRGVAKMKSGKFREYENAVKDFNQAIRLNPQEAKFFLKRGECFAETLEPQKAIEDFSQAIKLKPHLVEAYIGRAKIYATFYEENGEVFQTMGSRKALDDAEKAAKALADFNRAVEISPQNPDAYIARAKYYFQPLWEFKRALEDFNQAVQINSQNAEPLIDRAEFYLRVMEDYDSALTDLNLALRLDPRNAYAYGLRAEIYVWGKGYDEQAIADYTAALKIEPNDPVYLYDRAVSYRAIGKIRLAETDERKAKKLSKEKPPLTMTVPVQTMVGSSNMDTVKTVSEEQLADSYRDLWNKVKPLPDDALEEITRLDSILEANPRFVKALFERGNYYLLIRKNADAIADYSEAIKLNPQDDKFFNNRGIAYARKGDYESAIKDFYAALNLNSDEDSEVFYNRGLALLNKGEAEKAVEDFTQFIKYVPRNPEAYRLRAKAYRKLGKIAEAEADEKKLQSQ